MPLELPTGQRLITFDELPDNEFFIALPRADAQNTERDRKTFIALSNERVPLQHRNGEEDGYTLFFISRIDRTPGQRATVWLQPTEEVGGDEYVLKRRLTVFLIGGADLRIMPNGAAAGTHAPIVMTLSHHIRGARAGRRHRRVNGGH